MNKQILRNTPLLFSAIFIALSALMTSCADEEEFTTDRSSVLSFSQDTVRFDTIFSDVISVTQDIQVYNKGDKGLRIKDVRLESNGTSGFMINIDGQNGTSIHDIQVLDNDSVFLFIKVKAPISSSMEPTKINDAVIFTLESGVEQKVILEASAQNCQNLKGVSFENDKIISSKELPYVVFDSLVVGENATLTILEGTTLYFHNGANLIVKGKLQIQGTQEKPVILRGDRLDKMFDYLPYDRLENQWGGILLTSTCRGCEMNYADIHSGNFGVYCDSIKGDIQIKNSQIHNVAGYGLYLKDCKALIANTQISNTKNDCVSIFGGTTDFYHCTIAQFYPWKADRGHALYMSNYIDENELLIQSANFYNCFITGYDNDEVFGNMGDLPFNVNFYNSVLLTDTSDETYFHDCIEESKDSTTFKESNFRTFDTHAYIYDFRLDSASIARGKGSTVYSAIYPLDKEGITRGENPDAGCYQYIEK